jgi:ATP-dependent protease ClpP protease subunit
MSNINLSKKTRGQKHDIVEEIHNYNILLETRELFLHGEPGAENEDSGVDYRMSTRFIKNLRLLEQSGDSSIVIHQHSTGGECDSGMAIYDAILHCRCHIIFIMHGAAYSMGTIIPQAADTRIIMPNCIFMLHNGYIDFSGTQKQSQSYSEYSKIITEKMLNIYVENMVNGKYFKELKADIKRVKKFLNSKIDQKEDWWLFAEECVNYGFADATFGSPGYETIEEIRKNIENE